MTACFLVHRQCLLGLASLAKGLGSPIRETPTPWPDRLPRAPPPYPIALGVRFQQTNVGGTHVQCTAGMDLGFRDLKIRGNVRLGMNDRWKEVTLSSLHILRHAFPQSWEADVNSLLSWTRQFRTHWLPSARGGSGPALPSELALLSWWRSFASMGEMLLQAGSQRWVKAGPSPRRRRSHGDVRHVAVIATG